MALATIDSVKVDRKADRARRLVANLEAATRARRRADRRARCVRDIADMMRGGAPDDDLRDVLDAEWKAQRALARFILRATLWRSPAPGTDELDTIHPTMLIDGIAWTVVIEPADTSEDKPKWKLIRVDMRNVPTLGGHTVVKRVNSPGSLDD